MRVYAKLVCMGSVCIYNTAVWALGLPSVDALLCVSRPTFFSLIIFSFDVYIIFIFQKANNLIGGCSGANGGAT